MHHLALACLSLALAAPAGAAALTRADITRLPHKKVERSLPAAHPSSYYAYATRLFDEGAKKDALAWFYVGEIRYRFHLATQPSLPADGDPALFTSLHEVVGSRINGWAGADPAAWADGMQRALDWDAAHDNAFTSKTRHEQQWQETRSGLAQMQAWVRDNKEQILEQRRNNGL